MKKRLNNPLGIFIVFILIIICFSGIAFAIDVDVTQKGPSSAKKGSNVILSYEVKNNGSESIYNAQINTSTFKKQLGTINPGETKIYKHVIHIPTDAEIKKELGSNAVVSNPYHVEGIKMTFSDAQGLKYSINSNSVDINLIFDWLYDYQQVWVLFYEYVYSTLNTWVPTLPDNESQNSTISSEDAQKIAKQFILTPGVIAGEPTLVRSDGQTFYIIPIMSDGKIVGELYIDAFTGENMGGAGGVDYNLPENNPSSTTNQENNVNTSENDKINPESYEIDNEYKNKDKAVNQQDYIDNNPPEEINDSSAEESVEKVNTTKT